MNLFYHYLVVFFAAVTITQASAEKSTSLVIVRPSDPTYNQDIQEFNFAPSLNNHNSSSSIPAVYYAHSEQEVETALDQIMYSGSSTTQKRIQVRSGRHSYTALGQTTTGASVLDISNLTLASSSNNSPYPSTCAGEPCQLLKVPAGVRLFELYAFLAKQNLYFPGGSCPSVGLSGFVLGGGMGLYSRQHGLGAQNVFGARIAQVTENRQVVWKNVSETENFDLLWALRGGGNNNFGVVTEFTLRVYPAPTRVSSLRVQVNAPAACVLATQVYQDFLFTNNDDNNDNVCNITATLYYYHTSCAIVVLSTSLSFNELLEFSQENFIKRIPGSQITQKMQDEMNWLDAVASISGCSSVGSCMERSGRAPDLNGPSYWTAMSVFSNKNMTSQEIRPIVEAVQAPLESASSKSKILDESHHHHHESNKFNKPMLVSLSSSTSSTCSFFPVIIVDGFGCKVSEYGKKISTSFPWASSTSPALFHVQILAYNTAPSNFTKSEIESCQKEVDNYVFDIFQKYDQALPNFKASYRNYPSEMLPDALRRYYGSEENLNKLKNLAQEFDPLRMFSNYSQGLM